MKKVFIEKYKYSIVIAAIPLILLVLSIIFAMSNRFHWYFSFRIFILCLAYMLFTGIGILMFCVGYFIVSVIGQCIGAFIREHKL